MREKRLLTAEEIRQVETMAGYGMNVEQIAAILDMSKAVFERRMVDQPEVHEGILKGRAKASATVRKTAYQMAVSGKHAVMTIFWLKCRERWKEPREEEDDGTDAKPVPLAYVPKSQRVK